ncbi:MAG: ABC transporter permease [Bacillota bacterium]
MRGLLFSWYPIVWEEMVYWRRRFWLYLAVYMLSPLIFLLTFGYGVGQRVKMLIPGGMSYLDFLVPGVVALAVFNNGITSVTVRMFYNRLHFKSFEAYRLAPVGNFAVWFGYAVSGTFRGLLSGGIVLGLVLVLVPGFDFAPAGLLGLAAVAFSCGAFGVLLGLCLRSFDDQTVVSEFVIVPMTFLCGTLIPLERLPEVLQAVVRFLPLTPATEVLRAAFTGGPVPLPAVGLLGGWTALFFALGLWRLNCREE